MQVAALIPVSLHAASADSEPGHGGGNSLVLTELAGEPLLGRVCTRLAQVARLGNLTVVTTAGAADDDIAHFCNDRGLTCFRSTQEDELGRVLAALKSLEAKAAVTVRANAPLVDPAIIDHVANLVEMTDGMLDYIGTDLAQTYPRGMEVEAFTRAALEDADRRCGDPAERESAALYLRRNSRLYRLLGVKAPEPLQRPEVRFDVESAADIARLELLLRHFAGRIDFGLEEMLAAFDAHPDEIFRTML
ncbi:MAG: cytidylyltransferase domain-containing protein [Methylovirgula sp.]